MCVCVFVCVSACLCARKRVRKLAQHAYIPALVVRCPRSTHTHTLLPLSRVCHASTHTHTHTHPPSWVTEYVHKHTDVKVGDVAQYGGGGWEGTDACPTDCLTGGGQRQRCWQGVHGRGPRAGGPRQGVQGPCATPDKCIVMPHGSGD